MRSSDFKAEHITLIPSPKEMLWYNYQTMCNTNMLKTAKGAKKPGLKKWRGGRPHDSGKQNEKTQNSGLKATAIQVVNSSLTAVQCMRICRSTCQIEWTWVSVHKPVAFPSSC